MDVLKEVTTDAAPGAIGPYSQAIVVEGWIYASGQIALDPRTGDLVDGSVAIQTRQALSNLAAVLEAAGGGLDTVIRTAVYLTSMDTFSEMNSVYAEAFAGHCPARSTLEVSALPRGAAFEVDAVARVRG